MKKLILFLLTLSLHYAPAKAQFVTIPDTIFATWLTQEYPACMNGNQMDTTCLDIVTEDSVIVSFLNISNITGIEYFDNLQVLKCNANLLTVLPILPTLLVYLDCNDNLLTGLPSLPNQLSVLKCQGNQLSALPPLPGQLAQLSCGANQLVNLPVLPNSLGILACEVNQLSSLPALPNSLQTLACYQNQLTSLPQLSSALYSLLCYNNLLTYLPALPNNLSQLHCAFNYLDSLPQLPGSLTILFCNSNQLASLSPLPNSLNSLACGDNQLTNLPPLPPSMAYLECTDNQLTNLPSLPSTLNTLLCGQNQLTSLPTLPNVIHALMCHENQITSIPPVPLVMSHFLVNDNNISCLNYLPQVSGGSNDGNIANNPLVCVPNQTIYSLGLPLCLDNDPVGNPFNCPSVNITGNIYTDTDNNCTYSSTDLGSNNIPVRLLDSLNNVIAQSYTFNGVYSFSLLQPGTYQVQILTSGVPAYVTCGQSNNQTVVLDSANQTISNVNFPLMCEPGYDINLHSVYASGLVFPGQLHHLYWDITNNESWYNLDCDSSTSTGPVIMTINGPVSYVSALPGALVPQVNGNTFTYNISNFNNLTPSSFGLQFLTDTTAQAGDQICVHVEIAPTPLDSDTTNNVYDYCYLVVNSYDPNMKEVYPINVLPGYDDWFTYTIHFQNTGNAPAFNIRLRDTLDAQLDVSSFEILGYSHPAVTSINGNVLTVRFNNILLPDSTTDYEGSMGYFQYRLKPLPNLPNGSQIENTAYIYFDYNAPIITNTTQNNFDITVPVKNIVANEIEFVLYPNPSAGVFSFKDNNNLRTVEVFNLLGERVLTQSNQKEINLSAYSDGIYFAKMNGEVVIKLVKK